MTDKENARMLRDSAKWLIDAADKLDGVKVEPPPWKVFLYGKLAEVRGPCPYDTTLKTGLGGLHPETAAVLANALNSSAAMKEVCKEACDFIYGNALGDKAKAALHLATYWGDDGLPVKVRDDG